MTTQPPASQDSRARESVQLGAGSAVQFIFAAVVFVTSVLLPLFSIGSSGDASSGILSVFIPVIQIVATLGIVFSERRLAARQSADDRLARPLFWLYIAITASITFITLMDWNRLMLGWEQRDAYISLSAWLGEWYTRLLDAPATLVALVGTAICALIRWRALPKTPPKSVDQLPQSASVLRRKLVD